MNAADIDHRLEHRLGHLLETALAVAEEHKIHGMAETICLGRCIEFMV